MVYENIVEAVFLERKNRFVAKCLLKNEEIFCHVKNTGRCAELLIKGNTVYLVDHFLNLTDSQKFGEKRKYQYSLISVDKNGVLINIDSQAPNKVIFEALKEKRLILPEIFSIDDINDNIFIRPETTYKNSRFDFYIENQNKSKENKAFIEVKGVTLEKNGVALFPDAPTIRGVKHINELIDATKNGYIAYLIFVIQLKGIRYFVPNEKMHKEFAVALENAEKSGVKILCYDCLTKKNSLIIDKKINYILNEEF